MLLRVGIVNAVHPRPFQQHVGLYLYAAERCGTVGRKIGIGRSATDYHDVSPAQVIHRLVLGVILPDRFHAYGSQHLRLHPLRPQRGFQSQRVDDRREHSHLVALHTVESPLRTLHAAEYVSSSNNYADLHAGPGDFPYLRRIRTEYPGRTLHRRPATRRSVSAIFSYISSYSLPRMLYDTKIRFFSEIVIIGYLCTPIRTLLSW